MAEQDDRRFAIPLPGGRVARVPVAVLERYVDDKAQPSHGAQGGPQQAPRSDNPEPSAEAAMITIHVYADTGEVSVDKGARANAALADGDDVTAHSMSVDSATGTSEWHTDWEYGECEYTDESGFPQRLSAWHRHPFGTEYAELYEG